MGEDCRKGVINRPERLTGKIWGGGLSKHQSISGHNSLQHAVKLFGVKFTQGIIVRIGKIDNYVNSSFGQAIN